MKLEDEIILTTVEKIVIETNVYWQGIILTAHETTEPAAIVAVFMTCEQAENLIEILQKHIKNIKQTKEN